MIRDDRAARIVRSLARRDLLTRFDLNRRRSARRRDLEIDAGPFG
jgi:hypothetical protein